MATFAGITLSTLGSTGEHNVVSNSLSYLQVRMVGYIRLTLPSMTKVIIEQSIDYKFVSCTDADNYYSEFIISKVWTKGLTRPWPELQTYTGHMPLGTLR